MNDTSKVSPRTVEDRLKLAGLALGLASTALGLWVALKAQVIDATVSRTQDTTAGIQRQLLDQEKSLKELSVRNMEHEARVQLLVNWRVMPAKEFAQILRSPNSNLVWTDPQLQQQLMAEAEAWVNGRYLMGRSADKALLLRQVVCLEVANVGATPAVGLRLVGLHRDFPVSRAGTPDEPFGGLQPSPAAAEAPGAELGTLISGAQSRAMGSQLVIPLAQVVGPARYVGRVVLPRKLVWKNERMKAEESLPVDATSMALQAKLVAAYLGHSQEDSAPGK